MSTPNVNGQGAVGPIAAESTPSGTPTGAGRPSSFSSTDQVSRNRLRERLEAEAAAIGGLASGLGAESASGTRIQNSDVAARLRTVSSNIASLIRGFDGANADHVRTRVNGESGFAEFFEQGFGAGSLNLQDGKYPVDVHALVQQVLREAYLASSGDLKDQAEKVAGMNAQKKAVREHLSRLRSADAQLTTDPTVDAATAFRGTTSVGEPRFLEGVHISDADFAGMDANARKQAIKNADEVLNTLGDDSQLAQLQLQDTMQKQQQMIQLMSNISKMLHDTAMAIIRKIG